MKSPLSNRLSTTTLAAAMLLALGACSSSDDDAEEAPPTDNNASGGSQLSPGANETPLPADSTLGQVLATQAEQRTLYVRPGDAAGEITCTDECATTWPPLTTELEDTGTILPFTLIERPDGTRQYALQGYPLYLYNGDAAAGETSGDGLGEQWYAARRAPTDSGDTSLGETLVAAGTIVTSAGDSAVRENFDGRTLYNYASDTATASMCNDVCATTFPPLYADTGAVGFGDAYTVIMRDDGSRQWVFEGRPLYVYSGDAMAGDISGEGIDDLWSVVTQ